jgi:diacylglycerol kinase (ATP)
MHAAVARGDRLVIAWGGDGTFNEVASAVAFGPSAVAIVPSGSGNGLARSLGISRIPERAIADAIAARPITIDAGELGGRLFFSIGGIGFDAHVAAAFDRDRAGRRGLATYVRVTARELFGYRTGTYQVGEGTSSRKALLITFANSPEFGNGVRIAPGARLDDGLLDLVIVEEVSRFATVCRLPGFLIGGISRLPNVTISRIEEATVEGEGPIAFHVDGEPFTGESRLNARVHPRALKVCVR